MKPGAMAARSPDGYADFDPIQLLLGVVVRALRSIACALAVIVPAAMVAEPKCRCRAPP